MPILADGSAGTNVASPTAVAAARHVIRTDLLKQDLIRTQQDMIRGPSPRLVQ